MCRPKVSLLNLVPKQHEEGVFGTSANQRCSLATAELFLTVAAVVTRFHFEFVETTEKDILPARDCFIPRPVTNTAGVQTRIVEL